MEKQIIDRIKNIEEKYNISLEYIKVEIIIDYIENNIDNVIFINDNINYSYEYKDIYWLTSRLISIIEDSDIEWVVWEEMSIWSELLNFLVTNTLILNDKIYIKKDYTTYEYKQYKVLVDQLKYFFFVEAYDEWIWEDVFLDFIILFNYLWITPPKKNW